MKAAFFTSLHARLFLLIVLAVLPALGFIVYSDLEQRKLAAVQAQEDALRLAQLAADEQAQLILGAHQFLIALSQLPAVRDGDTVACTTLFANLLTHYPAYANLGAQWPNGDVFCSAAPLPHPVNVAHFAWFQRIVQNRDFTVGEFQQSVLSKDFILVLGYPVLDEANQLRAVVSLSVTLARLNQLVAHSRLPQGSTLTAVDRNGTIVARYPDPQGWLGQTLPQAPLIKAILTQGEGTAKIPGIDSVEHLYAFTQVREAADVVMYVSIGIPTEVAFAAAHQRLVRNLNVLGVMLLLIFAVAWVGSDWIVLRPVHALLRATQQLRAGDLTARSGLPEGLGELDQLVVAFDDMAEALDHREVERERGEAELKRLSRQLLDAQESERRAIARELHDELGQALQALKINLQTAQRFPQNSGQRLQESIGIVDHALQQVRNLSLDLRPSLLDDLGLVAALEWYVDRQAQRVGFVGHFTATPHDLRVDPALETVCFRVVQEALTNVARHAQAQQVWVEVERSETELHLRVRDDGVGFDVPSARERAARGASFGLLGMRERVELIGGSLETTSAPAQGTKIRVRFSLAAVNGMNKQPIPAR
ncbi:MAG: HAMP domain-containing protein [Deltaproteobacteria bacterium]|nr:HAMP domain-containing protein [Deltaproteobacteria bacterium]